MRVPTTVSRIKREAMQEVIDWTCDHCNRKFRARIQAEDHALLVHDCPVEERESPFGPLARLDDVAQANAWIREQGDCTIAWCGAGWYAPGFARDEGGRAGTVHYQAVDLVLDAVSRDLADLRAYEAALRTLLRRESNDE